MHKRALSLGSKGKASCTPFVHVLLIATELRSSGEAQVRFLQRVYAAGVVRQEICGLQVGLQGAFRSSVGFDVGSDVC